jgi:hypothetical protein
MRKVGIVSILLAAAAHAGAQAPPPRYYHLEQNWDQADRERFWSESQGSQLIRRDWFMALEQPGNDQPFRRRAYLESFGFVFSAPGDPNAAYALPIGFALDRNNGQVGSKGEEWLGLTCAACHTSLIQHGGSHVLIEGGPALIDLASFHTALTGALEQTLSDYLRWDRFARTVLGEAFDARRTEFRAEVGAELAILQRRERVNRLPADRRSGFGRLDAFGRIYNEVVALHLADEYNGKTPNAPVSYPHLWGSHQADRVQWNASANNRVIEEGRDVGRLARNVGQVLGVFARMELEPVRWPGTTQRFWWLSPRRGYASSAQIERLIWLEDRVKELRSPAWPEGLLGRIDRVRARQGAHVYAHHCSSCHEVVARRDEHLDYPVTVTDVGTDPLMARNFIGKRALTLALEGSKKRIHVGERFQAEATSFEIVLNAVVGVLYENVRRIPESAPGETPTAALARGFQDMAAEPRSEPGGAGAGAQAAAGEPSLPPARYRARPNNGIWATGPFLHNGSVPTLAELLEHRRVPVFRIESRQFDPVDVGVKFTPVAACAPGDGWCVDTRVPGNGNTGHRFGVHLDPGEKRALIEYMKTLSVPESAP